MAWKKTSAAMETTIMTETATIVAGAPKVFKEKTIITMEKKTAIIMIKTSKRKSVTSFNKEKKLYLDLW